MVASWEVQPSVLCAILHTDIVPTQWAVGLRRLIIPGPFQDPVLIAGRPYDHGRNDACQMALDIGAEWLFFLDSDVELPRDAIPRLISRGRPVISGVYARRSHPVGVPVMIKNGTWVTDYPPNSLIEVDVVGAGALLIHRSVLEQMPPLDEELGRRWFSWRVDRQHKLPPGEGMSEDFCFCLHLRRAMGIPVIVDTSVIASHMGLAQSMPGYFGAVGTIPVG